MATTRSLPPTSASATSSNSDVNSNKVSQNLPIQHQQSLPTLGTAYDNYASITDDDWDDDDPALLAGAETTLFTSAQRRSIL